MLYYLLENVPPTPKLMHAGIEYLMITRAIIVCTRLRTYNYRARYDADYARDKC